jgi:hypothetical protein
METWRTSLFLSNYFRSIIMQVIAYIKDGKPTTISPAVTVTDILDDDGNPTGETVTTDNLQSLIAALPQGTDYTLVAEADAETWWAAHRPPEDRKAEILARLSEIDEASIRPLRAIAQGEAVQADHDKLAALDAEATALRTELAGLQGS